jgi:hypothetical protein
MGPSSAGAIGWMQFEPKTWEEYEVAAHEEKKNPADPRDAIFAAAWLLKADGAPRNWYQAIFAYNHADWYVEEVEGFAREYAAEVPADPSAKGQVVPATVGSSGDAEAVTVSQGSSCLVRSGIDASGGATGSAIVRLARSQLGTAEEPPGSNCTQYGPCEEWCALFVAWVWQHAGIAMAGGTEPYGYSGSFYGWVKEHGGRVLPATATPAPGDAVLYGSGPLHTEHVGIVEEVLGGQIVTIEGNYSNQVFQVGPFPPALAVVQGEPAPIYAYAEPPGVGPGPPVSAG